MSTRGIDYKIYKYPDSSHFPFQNQKVDTRGIIEELACENFGMLPLNASLVQDQEVVEDFLTGSVTVLWTRLVRRPDCVDRLEVFLDGRQQVRLLN